MLVLNFVADALYTTLVSGDMVTKPRMVRMILSRQFRASGCCWSNGWRGRFLR